jgi:ribonuclease HIII
MKTNKNLTDKKIHEAFKTLEKVINKKAESIDPSKHELLAEITEHILNAMVIFEKIK